VDTAANAIFFVDNIWNSSASAANMSDAGVQGNGTVGQVGSSYFYYDEAPVSLPGNGIDLAYPAVVDLRVNSSVDASKQPVVTFEYNDGYGWREYDSVAFTTVHQLTSMGGFLVDGFAYNPVNYYDSELIIGGPGGGGQTTDTQSDLRLQLEYWNGHNYQLITNAYNYGSDTAESIGNALSQWYYDEGDGGVVAEVQSGVGTLGKLWDQSGVGVIDLKTSLPSGTLEVRNSSNLAATPGQYPFKNGEVTVTLEPGSYQLSVYSGTSLLTSGKYALAAGQLLELRTPLGTVLLTLSYSIVGGGAGYSPPILTYRVNGTIQTAPLGTTPTAYNVDPGSAWSVSLQLPGSSATERWQTAQAVNGSSSSAGPESITYYHQYLETVSYSVGGGGSGYSAPALSGQEFGAAVSLPVGTSPASYWLDAATVYSATNPLAGSGSSERWFALSGQGSVTASESIVIAYSHQFYLAVTGGAAASQWYDNGTQATISQPVTYGRAAGIGQRAVSYSVDGGAQTPIVPGQRNATIQVTMDSPHTLSFTSVTQDEVTLEAVAPQELDSITPPTISGDSYWYDSGSGVNVTLHGVWGRSAAGEGERLVSYSVNGGTQVPVSSKGPVTVLELRAISSPQVVTGRSTAQFFLDTGLGSLVSVSPTPISGDAGWYDNQTAVSAVYDYTWNGSADQTRLNAVSYSIDGGQTTPLPREGGGTFTVNVTMDAQHQIDVEPVTQYRFTYTGGFNVTLSLPSPTGDEFYDANSSTTATSSYIGGTVPNQQRQALTGYTLDSKATSIARNETGAFTTPPLVFDTYHALVFDSARQYFVTFSFTDASGSAHVVPTSLSIDQGNGAVEGVPGFNAWVDNGTAFTVASLIWEGVDVKPLSSTSYQVSAPENVTIMSSVYPASLKVVDLLGLGVQGAKVAAMFANGTTVTRATNSSGVVGFGLIPIGTYEATISNLGVSTSTSGDASIRSEAIATVDVSVPVVGIIIIIVLIVAALGASAFLVRRRGRRARPAPSPSTG
jgi:Thermopsin